MKNVNPYRGRTNLEPLWDHMLSQDPAPREMPERDPAVAEPAYGLVCQGEVWRLHYNGASAVVRDGKGYHDLARMLAEPGREFHCLELMGSGYAPDKGEAVLDAKARTAYRERIVELQEAMREADARQDSLRTAELHREYDALVDHLSGAIGLGGRTRRQGATAEKARSAVTWRIRSAIRKIGKVHPGLAEHLDRSVRTGTFCSYRPEREIDWVT